MHVKPAKPIEVFFSYSHKDEELRDELEKHLSILKRQGVITGWHDRRIGVGREWEGEIDTHLNTAHIILLLISADFLASDYCYDVEMKRAMERHEAGEARVIPIILRPVDWKGAPFGKLQALPKDAKPVISWPDLAQAFLDVAQGIRVAVEELARPVAGPHPVSEKPLEKGNILLNKYEILALLGSGALGNVYLAEDMDLKRKVAVKHLKPEYAADEEALERFREEASTVARLRHPNIAIVHGLEQEDGQSYIIMEYADRGTLRRFLAEEGPLPITQAIDMTIALCHALTAVHRQMIFHRDIKPSNILLIKVEDKIVPRLSDFGLSEAPSGFFYLGTFQYAPPEQLRRDPIDARSDIYSLGAVLYEMLTGRCPFTGSANEILRAQLEQEPLLPRSVRKGILPSLEKVVLKALSKKPEDRYQTTREMAEDLEIARREELEKEERVRDLYAQAEQYMHTRDWPMAIEMLEEISALDPNYKDTTQLLAETQKQITLKTTYEQGLAALNRRDWDEAERSFRRLLDIDENYEDAADILQETERQIRLRPLYAEARQLEEMEEWSEVIQRYAQIIAIDSGYEDVAQRLARAGESNRLQLLYAQANAFFTEKKWLEAAEKFREVLALNTQYKDAASRAKEAEKYARSQILYAKGMEFLKNGEWERAINRFEEIHQLAPGYEAVDARLAEAKRQKRWQDLFDEGMERRGRKDWQEAIEKFTQLLSENPKHPTAAMLLEEAKRRQTHEETRAKLDKENPIIAWWSSQEATVKAAWIGGAATLLAALCGFLGGDTTLEIARYLWGTDGNVLGVVVLIGFAMLILGPIVLSLPIRRVYTKRGRDAWEQNIQELLLEGKTVEPRMLRGLSREGAVRILQKYPQRHPEQDLVYVDSAQQLAFLNRTNLEIFASSWAQALVAISHNQFEDFKSQVIAITDVFCETLGFTRLRSAPYKRLFGIVVNTPTIRLRIPSTFPVIYLYRHQFSREDIDGLRNMMAVMGVSHRFALIVTFGEPQAVQQMLDRYLLRPVHGYDFVVLGENSIQRILTAKDPEQVLIQAILEQVTLTVISPFSTEGPAPENMFFGRDRELKEIEAKIANVSFALVGNRRIGKTSIVRRIQRTLNMEKRTVLFLDCHAASDYKGFFEFINMDKGWQLSGLPITDYSPLSFARLITPLSQGSSPVFILLDEVDYLLSYDEAHDWALTRNFRTLSQTGQCRFLFTGIKTLYQQKHNPGCPLYNFCDISVIKYLERKDAERLIMEPMNLMAIDLENERELLNRILDISMVHPSIIQWICAALIKEISKEGSRRIKLGHIDAVCQSGEFYDYFVETILGVATSLERIIAFSLEEGTYTPSEILQKLSAHGITPAYVELDKALAHLELYSILQKVGKRYSLLARGLPKIARKALDVETEIEMLKEDFHAQSTLPNY